LAAWKVSSIAQRVPAMRTMSCTVVPLGA
jgi:hypothetical protein